MKTMMPFKDDDDSETTKRILKSLDEVPPSLRDKLRKQERELEGCGFFERIVRFFTKDKDRRGKWLQ
ncbi:hypothetical protein [Succinimonas sp.]|uniref:hypothetical protein n=1 Tax=Succinimonas sp. TaxID=1936151 RepID=UPI0038703F47